MLGVLCTLLGLSFVWPQVIRVFRAGVEGISPRGQLQAISGGTLWTIYGFATANPPLITANLICLVLACVIAVVMVRHHKMPAWHLIAALTGFIAFGTAMSLISPSITGWFAIVIGATSILPQTIYALRYANLSGLSVPMYCMLVTSCSLWTLYGFVIGDLLVSMPNFLVAPCAAIIGVKAWRYQRRRARAIAVVEPVSA